MALGRPLGAKLFIEGMEVPFIGSTITWSVGQASIAYIDVVPHAEINNIKPRTTVEIAVRDYNDIKGGYPYVTAWEGEVFGYSFGKQVGSRSFTISAIDSTSYWDNVLCYYMNTQQLLGKAGLDMLTMGIDVNLAQQFNQKVLQVPGSISSYFKSIVDEVLSDSSKDFLDAFVEVYKRISDINDFYNFAEKRFRIRDRMLLHSTKKLQFLLSQGNAREWFQGIVNQAGGFQTLRNVVQDLLGIIFHDFVPVPFPARVQRIGLEGSALPSTDALTRTIGSYIFKPNLYMIPPPLCNVFFPDEYSQFQFSRNFFQEPTRLIYKPEMPFYNSDQKVALPYIFEPPSLANFMLSTKGWSSFQNTSDIGVTGDPGKFLDTETNENFKRSNLGKKRESQFLTNEERIKGIWMAQEGMMPAATAFLGNNFTESFKREFCQKVAQYLFYKKRFQNRSLQITSHLKLSVVPGFTVLLLDDSDAEQQVVAYCSSVTHRIYATEGGYTNVSLSYARTVGEQEQSNTSGGEPIVPPWYSEEIFGKVTTPPQSNVVNSDLLSLQKVYVSTNKLSQFYQDLLGDRGVKSLTDYKAGEPTLLGSVTQLLDDYRKRRRNGDEDRQAFISEITSRDYVKVVDSMKFKGATTTTKSLSSNNFTDFTGGAFDANDSNFGDIVSLKQEPIKAYRDALKKFRGFRG